MHRALSLTQLAPSVAAAWSPQVLQSDRQDSSPAAAAHSLCLLRAGRGRGQQVPRLPPQAPRGSGLLAVGVHDCVPCRPLSSCFPAGCGGAGLWADAPLGPAGVLAAGRRADQHTAGSEFSLSPHFRSCPHIRLTALETARTLAQGAQSRRHPRREVDSEAGAGSDHEDPDRGGRPAPGPWGPPIGELSDAEDKAAAEVSTLSSAVTGRDPRLPGHRPRPWQARQGLRT